MEILQVNEDQQKKLATVLKNFRIQLFEYIVDEDKLVVYDDKFHIKRTVTDYMEYIDHKSKIHPDDREKVKQLYMEVKEDPVEIREIEKDGTISHTLLELTKFVDEATGKTILVGNAKDITEQKEHEKMLKEQAMKDPLTGIYNQIYGKMLINRYLNSKNPFEACGMILLDIDYFKAVNDHYGHLFGDKIILSLTDLLKKLFSDKNSVLVRAGGDEFVIFIANISNIELVRKNVQLMQNIRNISFEDNDCRFTCSAGVCYLPENISGYSYDQLFENADIALYKAKERGRNCYVYCDSLQHFTMMSTEHEEYEEELTQVGEELLKNDGILTVSYTNNMESQLEDMLSVLDSVIVVLIISAGMLAFVVLYNLNNININERKRELATLKVLGFYDMEVGNYVYRENILLTIIGAVAGVFLGKVLHQFVIQTVEVEMTMFGRNINMPSYLYAIGFTFLFSLLVNLVMYFKLKKINMVESLKSVE